MFKRTLARLSQAERLNLSQGGSSKLFDLSNIDKTALSKIDSEDLIIYPSFLNGDEQRTMLMQMLKKLDRVCGKPKRSPSLLEEHYKQYKEGDLQKLFCHPDMYRWETSHFDNVITGYREANVRSMTVPNAETEQGVKGILERLYKCLYDNATDYTRDQAAKPPKNERLQDDELSIPHWLQAHILQLSPKGSIQAHVDNEDAMGSTIMGLSLGECRQVEFLNEKYGKFTAYLPSGSVYLQRSKLRYEYKHSILQGEGRDQRLTLMLRDQPVKTDE
ncbi:hypothetical protein E3P77_02533 [Wallemia ichthyophaga]|nr:hypothetical protein E3P77_02533 [Wallemia ichthyophaga]